MDIRHRIQAISYCGFEGLFGTNFLLDWQNSFRKFKEGGVDKDYNEHKNKARVILRNESNVTVHVYIWQYIYTYTVFNRQKMVWSD